MEENEAALLEQIELHPDTELYFRPLNQQLNADAYEFVYPLSSEYRIGLLMDPCRYNSPDCCMNIYGSPEYHALLSSGLQQERVFKYNVLADEDEIRANYFTIDQDGSTIAYTNQRFADDEAILNTSCAARGDPYSSCLARNYGLIPSLSRPPCVDNNISLDIMGGCDAPNGTHMEKCAAIAYTSNAFIPQCIEGVDDPHCGTFVEIHISGGSPVYDEETIISEVRIDTRNVSGYYTTTIPTTFIGDPGKVLCSYSESELRIGSPVYILSSAPVCCCPPPFQVASRVGSFQCPKGPTGNGAFARTTKTTADKLVLDFLQLAYPFCPTDLEERSDRMMCSVYDVHDRRHYSRNCTPITQDLPEQLRGWTSPDIVDFYEERCPYYDSCAETYDDGKCRNGDLRFTFIGMTGLITQLDNVAAIPQAWVTFNGGRTSYQFSQQDIVLETQSKSMYGK